MITSLEGYQSFPHEFSNSIVGPTTLSTFVFSVYFHFGGHSWLHLWPVHWWCAVEYLGQANLLLVEVEHRIVLIFYQRASSKLEYDSPLQMLPLVCYSISRRSATFCRLYLPILHFEEWRCFKLSLYDPLYVHLKLHQILQHLWLTYEDQYFMYSINLVHIKVP